MTTGETPPLRKRSGTRQPRRRFRLTGLRTRLLAGFAAVALLTTVAIAGVSYALTRRAMVEQVQQSAERAFKTDMTQEARAIASAAGAEPQHTQQELQNVVEQLAAGPQKVVLIVNSTNVENFENSLSTIVQQDVPSGLRKAVGDGMVLQRTHVNGTPYLVLGTQVGTGGPEVYEFYSLASDEQDLDRLAQSYVYAALVALIAASLLALLAAQGVLRPIRRLGFAARRLGEGHLDTRAEVHGSDEIADVARTFNDTARALEQGVTELRAMEAASRRFVADVSHELRTPLTAMTAVTDMLEDATDVGDESAPATRLVVTETRRLARLVEDLIEVSRFDAGTAALRLEIVDFVQLVEASLAARGWRDKVARQMPERLMARVDPRRVDVVLANLVGNALKHGGEPVTLWLRARNDDLLLTVRDSGPGIPADALPHVFERFYKADRARGRSEGSGLGLSIAHENARMHGGRLEARNEPDGGASFSLLLPKVRQPDEPAGEDEDDIEAAVRNRATDIEDAGPAAGAGPATDTATDTGDLPGDDLPGHEDEAVADDADETDNAAEPADDVSTADPARTDSDDPPPDESRADDAGRAASGDEAEAEGHDASADDADDTDNTDNTAAEHADDTEPDVPEATNTSESADGTGGAGPDGDEATEGRSGAETIGRQRTGPAGSDASGRGSAAPTAEAEAAAPEDAEPSGRPDDQAGDIEDERRASKA